MSNILRSKITDEIGKLFTEYNAFTSVSNEYSGWTPELDSNVLRIFCEVHQRVAGKLPLVTAIHAGLECGIIKNINPRLDIISFGPEIRNAHSPDEYVSIPSVERFWLLLLELLRSL
jgi:dipeptidase D